MPFDAENPEVSTSIPVVSDPSLNRVVRRKLKRLIILNSVILVACSIALVARIYIARNRRKHGRRSFFVFELIVMVTGIINAVFGLTLAIYERRKYSDHRLNCKSFHRLNFTHLILNTICGILFSLFFIIQFIRWYGDLLNDDQVRNGVRLVVILLALVIGICQTACVIENRVLAWCPKYRYSRFVLCFSSIIHIAISIASIIFNARDRHLHQGVQPRDGSIPLWCYKIFQASLSYTLVCGVVGVCLTFVYGRKDSELDQFRKYLQHFFNILSAMGLLLGIILTIILLSCETEFVDETKWSNVHTLKHPNPFLSTVHCILLSLGMSSLRSLVRATRPCRNGLTAERIRLSRISPTYITHWAAAIDAFNCIPDGMTGDAALQLMKAYENGQLENIECVVLRIRRSGRRISMPKNRWDDTEALVLLTIIHGYDATGAARLNEFWSTVLKRTLGSENCTKHFRPLLLRLGLIGYQWPFRTSIFFTAPHQDPLIRAAHILETVIDWNEMQKSNIRCDVLLLPTYSTELIAKAIPIAGFFPLPLPPTHLLDLRPHRGKTWGEYMRTLKRGNRRPYIQQFLTKGGTIEEVYNLKPREVGETVCKQWKNIARIRRENKEPPTLAKPSAEFISSMGNAMSETYRSIVFLRFNNEVIASSVIYKFPHKLITIDIQGLTHAKARPLNAYFVMLQWVIREALDKKYDFVDFGPTTPGPKIDLGCVSVPLEAGGYARNPILAFGIQQAGSTVDTIHKKKDIQQQSISVQDKSQLDTQPPASNTGLRRQIPSNSAPSRNIPKKQKQVKNVDKTTNIPEGLSVVIENETRVKVRSPKNVNPSKNNEQITSNGNNRSRRKPAKKKHSNDETSENQSLHKLQSSDIVSESNNSPLKNAPQPTDALISTDTSILQKSLSDPLISCNINEEIKHDNNERLCFV